MGFIINMIGFLLIFIAMDIKRTPECKVELFSIEWFLQVILIVIATEIFKYNS